MRKQIFIVMLTLFIAVILASSASAVMTVSNGIYNVSVQNNTTADDVGTWTACTGPNHPYPNEDILFNGVDQDPWSTYLTVRDVTGLRDYTSASGVGDTAPGYAQVDLDDSAVSVTQTGPNQITTYWSVGAAAPLFDVYQVISILGTTYQDSMIQVTTTIRNTGDTTRTFAIRYFWDLAVASEDGSQVRPRDPDGPWQTTEEGWIDPSFKEWEATDDPNAPTFSVYGSVIYPAGSTPPGLLTAAYFDDAYDEAYDYTPTGHSITEDSAMLYYWDPLVIASRGSTSVTAFIFAGPFNQTINTGGNATNPATAAAATTTAGTIPMQNTGLPLAGIALAIVMVVGGFIGTRKNQ